LTDAVCMYITCAAAAMKHVAVSAARTAKRPAAIIVWQCSGVARWNNKKIRNKIYADCRDDRLWSDKNNVVTVWAAAGYDDDGVQGTTTPPEVSGGGHTRTIRCERWRARSRDTTRILRVVSRVADFGYVIRLRLRTNK